jgi:lipopolysaccharide export system permease protein
VISLLHRMIFIELFRVFFLCWVGLTGIVLLAGVIAEASQQGLGPVQILQVIPFLIPSTMPYTLPTTTLFATCVVYGRMAHDNEVLAIKAAGINVFQAVIPSLVLGGLASLGTMVLYLDVIPSTHWALRTHLTDNVEELIYSMLRKDGFIRTPEYEIRVHKVSDRDLIDATFMHRGPKGIFDMIARGKKAEISVDQEAKMLKVRMWNGSARKDNGDIGQFEFQEWSFEMPKFAYQAKTRPTDMTWNELATFRKKFEDDIEAAKQEIAQHEAVIITGNAPPGFVEHIGHRRLQIRSIQGMITNIDTEYQMRPSLALGCLCFVLVACPVGIWFSRSDYLSSFITCFLPIIVVYYPLMLCGVNFAKSGKFMNALPHLPAAAVVALTIWPANVVTAAAALFMMRRLVRT